MNCQIEQIYSLCVHHACMRVCIGARAYVWVGGHGRTALVGGSEHEERRVAIVLGVDHFRFYAIQEHVAGAVLHVHRCYVRPAPGWDIAEPPIGVAIAVTRTLAARTCTTDALVVQDDVPVFSREPERGAQQSEVHSENY
jgi:hypothetical protein